MRSTRKDHPLIATGRGAHPSALLVLACVLGPSRLLAQTTQPPQRAAARTLTWDAPSSCPTVAEVEARIAARVDAGSGDVRVRVVEVAEGVRVDMSTGGADRSFVAPTCDDAATAVAVIVALAAHAEHAAPPVVAPQPIAAPAVVPPAVAPPVHDGGADRPAEPARVTRWSFGAGAALDTSAPHLSPGVTVAAQARRGLGAIAVSGSVFLPETEHAGGAPPVQTTVTLVDVLALGCVIVPVVGRLAAGGCVGPGLGMLHGQSERIDRPRANVGFRFEGALLARLELRLTAAVVLRLEGGAVVDPVRRPFRVEGVGDVYRPPAVAMRLGTGVDVRFR